MSSRLAIVTGTSSGIGEALTSQLLEDGWQVFGVARREVKRPESAYRHIQADLSDVDVVSRIIGPTVAAEMAFGDYGRLALVNNAANSGQTRSFGELDQARLARDMTINLATPLALMDQVIRQCPEAVKLQIVNVSSGLAHMPLPGAGDYCSAKAGLLMASQVVAGEQGGKIGILSYEPGIVDTGMQVNLRGQSGEAFVSAGMFQAMHEEGRLAQPQDVIKPIVEFLDSDATGFHEGRYEPA